MSTEKIKYDDISSLPDEYIPIIHEITVSDKKIYDASPELSSTIASPLFSMGYQAFLSDNKEKMEESLIQEIKEKKKIYLIVHPFESYIDDYDASLDNVSVDYFKLDSKPKIVGRSFYKLWELIAMFDLVPTKGSSFKSAHIAEAPGSFAQATMFYRDLFAKKNGDTKKDSYYLMSLDSTEDPTSIHDFDSKFVKYYENEKPQRLFIHKTVSPAAAEASTTKDDGDLTNPKTIKIFSSEVGGKANFITADGGMLWKNKLVQEQEATHLVISEIVTALKNLDIGGNFVCRIYETFTTPMCKILYVLSSAFEEMYIVKPLLSHASSAEKYLVCKKYLGKTKILEQFTVVHEALFKHKTKHLIDLFPELHLSKEFVDMLTKNNVTLSNRQFLYINKIIEFIQSKNYFGDVYQDCRMQQITSTGYWINTYYPNDGEYSKMSKLLTEIKKRATKE